MAAHYDLTIDQGATLRRSFQWLDESSEPIDITGCHIRARIFCLHIPEPALVCTDETGEFTITDALAGAFDLEIEDEVTDTLLWPEGSWRLDVLHADGSITALREGDVTVRSHRGDTNGNGADETVIIMTTGIQGPPGAPGAEGPEGPPGSGGGTYTAGAGLALTGNSFSIDPAGTVTTGRATIGVGAVTSALTDLLVNPTTKASGNLIDAQVNSVSKFKVTFAGVTTINTPASTNALVFQQSGTDVGGFNTADGFRGYNSRGLLIHEGNSAAPGNLQAWFSASGAFFRNSGVLGFYPLQLISGTQDTTISRNAAGIMQVGTNAANALGHLALTSVLLQPVTVATLPTGVEGRYAYVSDGTAALAWGATVTGGGATKYLVWYNGTNWTVAGK